MSLFGVSRGTRDAAVQTVERAAASEAERFNDGLSQIRGKTVSTFSARNKKEAFVMEAKFESHGTVYPWIRKPFIVSILILSLSVIVNYIIIPILRNDQENPMRMLGLDHQSYRKMVTHFVPALCFLYGAFLQKELIKTIAKHPKYIKYHRLLGRITCFFSMTSSLLALRITPFALYGTQISYVPWNLFWIMASFNTWNYARKKNFGKHRLWANVLVHTAFLFVTSRVFLMVGIVIGLPLKVVYVSGINGSVLLAFFWYLLESGQYNRNAAVHKRWEKLRSFTKTYGVLTKIQNRGPSQRERDQTEEKKTRTCGGCATPISSHVMMCHNRLCNGFNDTAQGEFAQLVVDTGDPYTCMPFRIGLNRVLATQKNSPEWAQMKTILLMPFLVVYIWMAIPVINSDGDMSFMALVTRHVIYIIICVHMCAGIVKCYPIVWRPNTSSEDHHISSKFWNFVGVVAGVTDAIFLYFCRAYNLWIDRNPTWILALVVAFVPFLLAPYFFSEPTMPRRAVRALYAAVGVVIAVFGYLGATFAAHIYRTVAARSGSTQLTLGLLVGLQLYEEILCQVSKGIIGSAIREFGLDDKTVPAEKRSNAQKHAVANMESLMVLQEYIFGFFFFCFYRELWTTMESTLVCITTQFILILQDFNIIFGSTVLRCVRVIVESPVLQFSGHHVSDSLQRPIDRRAKSLHEEICVRLSRSELTESLRALSLKLLVRLITMAATPLFGVICRYGPNATGFPTWSGLSDAQFYKVLTNFIIMFVLEGLFIAAIVSSLYKYFRVNLLELLTSTVMRSKLTQVIVVCSAIHELQDLYVATIDMTLHHLAD